MTEDEFQSRIIEAAKLHGWLCHHVRPARTAKGWRTPVEGHAGFLDLVLLRRGVLVILEVKSDDGELTDEEATWLAALLVVSGITVRVVRPSDWAAIEALLR